MSQEIFVLCVPDLKGRFRGMEKVPDGVFYLTEEDAQSEKERNFEMGFDNHQKLQIFRLSVEILEENNVT